MGHDHGGDRAPAGQAEAHRRGYRRCDDQHLPLRHLPTGARSDPYRRQERIGGISHEPISRKSSRRSFIVGTAAVGSGLAIGLNIPFGGRHSYPCRRRVAEVTAWLVIQPDDTVVIRMARSEMGQGTLTGLAQIVAEELECDSAKVTTEYPTPGQSVARKRAWGDFSTGGSRGIRESNEYVRKAGASRA